MNLAQKFRAIAMKKPKDQVIGHMAEPSMVAASKKPEPNPYLNARRTWNSHVGGVVSLNHVLIALALISMFIACGAVGGLINVASKSKFIPFFAQLNDAGEQVGGRALSSQDRPTEREIHAAVAKFISEARLVTSDAALQRKAVFTVYSMLSPEDPATKKMNEFLNGTDDANPFKRAEKEMVSVEVKSAIPQTADTWQVDWLETVRDRQGVQVKPPYMMRALVTVYQAEITPDTTEQQLQMNARNIRVRDYSWAQQN